MKTFRSFLRLHCRPARSDCLGGIPMLGVARALLKRLLAPFKRSARYSKSSPSNDPPAFRPPTRFERYVLSARVLSHLAMLCWGISLCLPLFVYSDRVDYGGNLLTRGWLGILGLQFPWVANPLLLITYIRLQKGCGATVHAFVAFAIALQTFTTDMFEQSYGYGWGMVLWFLSLALMFAAAGAHEMRGWRRHTFEDSGWLRSVGLGLFAVIGTLSVALAFYDHQKPNIAEAKRMEHVAIKRGAVCQQDVASTERIDPPLSGALEVKQTSVQRLGSYYEKEVPLYAMLDWGIPIVRSEGRDYFYIKNSKETLLSSIPAEGPAGATLELDGTHEGIHLRLLNGTGARLFDQSWVRKGRSGYCPDYFAMPKSDQQPRLMIAQALGLNAPAVEITKTSGVTKTRLAGHITGRSQSTSSKEELVPNAKCAQGIGWERVGPLDGVVSRNSSKSFMIGRQAYYPPIPYGKALCQGSDIYLYNTTYSSAKTVFLTIEKRQSVDFALVGSTDIQMDNPTPDEGPLQLESVENKGETMTVGVSRPDLGLKFNVEASSGF